MKKYIILLFLFQYCFIIYGQYNCNAYVYKTHDNFFKSFSNPKIIVNDSIKYLIDEIGYYYCIQLQNGYNKLSLNRNTICEINISDTNIHYFKIIDNQIFMNVRKYMLIEVTESFFIYEKNKYFLKPPEKQYLRYIKSNR